MRRIETSEPAGARILVVDDDPGIRDVLVEFLGRHGFEVSEAGDAAEMDQVLSGDPPDLVVLDLMLPGEDGLSICKRLSQTPGGPGVIMLSAMGEETDRIVGLELGADDYLPKPCNPRELLARVRAVLRRRRDAGVEGAPGGGQVCFAGWRLDMIRRELRGRDGEVVTLSGGEFNLLRALVERPNRVLSRDQLLELARGHETEAFDRAVDVQISRLRRKLDDGAGSELIRTVRGEGYLFAAEVSRR